MQHISNAPSAIHRDLNMTKTRRFPDDVTEEAIETPEAPLPRRRPADKRWRRPHSDKSSRPVVTDEASPSGDTNAGHDG